MIVVGGTYSEICLEPIWENIYGSGFRAVNLISEYDNSKKIEFYTCADDELERHIHLYESQYNNLSINITSISESPEFHYDHPLKTPAIYPRPDKYCGDNIKLEAEGENILFYGLLEASAKVYGKKVVYDPQSPVNPKAFSSTGSKADKLIYIINISEAHQLCGSKSISDIKRFFFDKEDSFALILKMGAQGALLIDSQTKNEIKIPVYKTNKVWPIGSGDVFSAFFALNWFNSEDLIKSATLASKATAIYCNTKNLAVSNYFKSFSFDQLIINDLPKNQIYLAGPFFTFSERWLINEIWNIFKSFGLRVFSPFHDVGHGKAQDVVEQDLIGLDTSDVVYAVIDGLDSGTLFEVGYAIAKRKKVIVFVQNEDEESLKMFEGSDCILERDFATSLYKTFWMLV